LQFPTEEIEVRKILCLFALLPLAAFGAVVGPDTINTPVANAAAAATQAQGQDQLQGQAQGQLQGQAQGNFNAVGVDVDNDVRNANTNLVGIDVDNRVNSASVSGAISGSIAGARADQSQTIAEGAVQNSTSTATDQSQSQSASADNAGNTQTITYNEATDKTVRSAGTVEVRSVPTAIAPNVYPTASCAMSASVGASALGWGVSGGGTKVNEECMKLEAARMFAQLGYPVQGIIVACSTKSSLEVFGSAQACVDAGTPKAPVAVASTPVAAAQPVAVETTVPFGEVK
jgi:hypothetical protein